MQAAQDDLKKSCESTVPYGFSSRSAQIPKVASPNIPKQETRWQSMTHTWTRIGALPLRHAHLHTGQLGEVDSRRELVVAAAHLRSGTRRRPVATVSKQPEYRSARRTEEVPSPVTDADSESPSVGRRRRRRRQAALASHERTNVREIGISC